jgi:hypothetical protein
MFPSRSIAYSTSSKQRTFRRRTGVLRAAYWLDTANRVWHMSKSLSYLAVINAIETLLPEQGNDPCPCCGLNRSPGSTARFREFLETYATSIEPRTRTAMYRLRSTLVHGHGLHGLDRPRGFGELSPGTMEHWDLHGAALSGARIAILNWLFQRGEV